MSHNLEAINAALRLGDRFVPPAGTEGVLDYLGSCAGRYPCIVTGVNTDYGFHLLEVIIVGVPICRVSLESLVEVVSVLEEAPPFEEWERPA